MTHNFIKVSLLQALSITNDYDIICLNETFLDSSIDKDGISIPEYNFLHVEHPSNTKRGGVCTYYKDHLLIDMCQLHECLVTELRIGEKNVSLHVYIILLVKHPMNLRISGQILTYSCQMSMTLIQHALL